MSLVEITGGTADANPDMLSQPKAIIAYSWRRVLKLLDAGLDKARWAGFRKDHTLIAII
jgi:hypothetical protein